MATDSQGQKLCLQFIESVLESNPNKAIPVDSILYQAVKRYNVSSTLANRVFKLVVAGLGAEIDRAANTVTYKKVEEDAQERRP